MSGLPDDLNPRFWPWVEGDTRRDPEPEDGPTLAEAWFDPRLRALLLEMRDELRDEHE